MARGKKNQGQIVEIPEREMVINRANAKQIAKGQTVMPKPTLASTRTRRRGTDKAYSNDAPPVDVARRVPVVAAPVPRLPGQEAFFAANPDIPSSPINGLQSQSEPGPLHDRVSTDSMEFAGENTERDLADVNEPDASHPFGGLSDTSEPYHQAPPNPTNDNSLILAPSAPQSSLGHRNDWNHFHSDGEFSNWRNNQVPQSEFAPLQSNSTHPQSEFAPPQSALASHHLDFPVLQSPFNASQSSMPTDSLILRTELFAPSNNYHSLPNAQAHVPSADFLALPNGPLGFASGTTSTQVSNGQWPPSLLSYSDNSQTHVSQLSASNDHALPPNDALLPSTSYAGEEVNLGSQVATSSSHTLSDAPVSTPIRSTTAAARTRLRVHNSSKKISSKTPQRKHMKANVAAHFAVQRQRHQRLTQNHQQAPLPTTAGTEAQPPQSSQSNSLTPDQQAVSLIMPKTPQVPERSGTWGDFAEPLLTPNLYLEMRESARSNSMSHSLKIKESALRGEFTNLIMSFVQDYYEISPSSQARIDSLIQDDCFLYSGETITPRSQLGFFGARSLLRAVGMFLFQHPHNLGTLFIEELCAEDPPKRWHAKATDRSATNGAPIALIAFAGVAILHCLHCIRDRSVTGKKAYKFEQARYGHIWTRYRKELIKYRHLGELRRTYLAYIKRRYNEMNRTSKQADDDSDMEDDEEHNASSSDYASDDPTEGATYRELSEELDED
ncbi:hypothetical protein BDV93DRAFT_565525 [Ceratobasidium sp. AG-I]|nr:hypothetical protein BDV93DRAFT_565525 [Ceratobasidium sp. AG-I]